MKKQNPTKLEIDIGPHEQDYQAGNFLNAIDSVVCYFRNCRSGICSSEIAAALKLYALNVEGGS